MKNLQFALVVTLAVSILAVASASFAGSKNNHDPSNRIGQHHDYAKVIKVAPVYREARLSTPIREC
jgi:hypothetical protein